MSKQFTVTNSPSGSMLLLPFPWIWETGKSYPLRYEKRRFSYRPLQDLYDLATHPSIGDGEFLVAIEILAPNGRVVQVTEDLPGFWSGSYREVKRILRVGTLSMSGGSEWLGLFAMWERFRWVVGFTPAKGDKPAKGRYGEWIGEKFLRKRWFQ